MTEAVRQCLGNTSGFEREKCCSLTSARSEIYAKACAGRMKRVDKLSVMTLQNGVEKVLVLISVFT